MLNKNIDSSRRSDILNVLGVREVARHEKYLALPTIIGRSKRDTFACLKERIWKEPHGWKEMLLDCPGKEVLFKAVGQSTPTYMMRILCLQEGMLDENSSMLGGGMTTQGEKYIG